MLKLPPQFICKKIRLKLIFQVFDGFLVRKNLLKGKCFVIKKFFDKLLSYIPNEPKSLAIFQFTAQVECIEKSYVDPGVLSQKPVMSPRTEIQ